jgi:hypothetical protein
MIIGKKTSKTSFLKDCPGCGDKFWGRANAVYHSEECRKKHKYPEIKRRKEAFAGLFKDLERLSVLLNDSIPPGQTSAVVSWRALAACGANFKVCTGRFLDPKEEKTYFMCGSNLMWRTDGENVIIRKI